MVEVPNTYIRLIQVFESAAQENQLLIRWSQVQVLHGPPTNSILKECPLRFMEQRRTHWLQDWGPDDPSKDSICGQPVESPFGPKAVARWRPEAVIQGRNNLRSLG